MQLEELPEEILIFLLHKFHPRDLCTLSLLNKELNRLVNDEVIWKAIAWSYWPMIANKHETLKDNDWKQYHIYRSRVEANWNEHKCKKFALRGHHGTVFSVKMVDDNHLISSGEDGLLHIWNHTTKQHVLAHQAHEAPIIGLDYDQATNTAVSGSSDLKVKLWKYSRDPRAAVQAMSVKEIKELLTKHNISMRDCFEKSDLVDKVLYNRLVSLMACTHTLSGHSGAIIGTNYDSKSGLVAAGSFDQTARVWDVNNGGKHIFTLSGHRGTVNCVQIVDHFLFSGANDAKVVKTDIHTGQSVLEFIGHIGWVWNLHYSPSAMLSCSIDHKVILWDSLTAKPTAVLGHHSAEVCGLQGNFETKKFISTGFDGQVLYWDMRKLAEPLMTLTYEERCTRATFNENMIAVATFGQVVQLYDFTST
eukprot:Phypoly_transcript_08599.p1 GENE.Phypoly_transcript_08599~~Phypoly_transcript_08599.p1  ORF type:complete len:419 (+),score=57.46 Phypoly_transcript_08599:179-1435(+)